MRTSLTIAESGPCAGHPCDGCKTCAGRPPGNRKDIPGKAPRCCRRDNPEYQLPAEGDWDGPIFGDLGVLERVGDDVTCHACGGAFASLAAHAWGTHDLTAAEYKAIFGLKVSTALVSDRLRRQLSEHMRRLIAAGEITTIDQRPDDAPTPEQLSAYSAGRRNRRESRRMTEDPEFRARIASRVSEARGGKKQMTCVICGRQERRYWANRTKTCGPACRSILASRTLKGRPKSPAWRQALSEAARRRNTDDAPAAPAPGERGMEEIRDGHGS